MIYYRSHVTCYNITRISISMVSFLQYGGILISPGGRLPAPSGEFAAPASGEPAAPRRPGCHF